MKETMWGIYEEVFCMSLVTTPADYGYGGLGGL